MVADKYFRTVVFRQFKEVWFVASAKELRTEVERMREERTNFGQVTGTMNWESSKSVHWQRTVVGRISSSTRTRVIAENNVNDML